MSRRSGAPGIAGVAVRRGAAAAPTLLVVLLLTFGMVSLIPGDAATVVAGDDATAARVAEVRTSLGLDRPLVEQFASWLGGVVTGDLGESVVRQESVVELLIDHSQVTLALAALAQAFVLLIGLPLGLAAGLRDGSRAQRLIEAGALVGTAIPNFVVAIALLSFFAVGLGWFPAGGFVAPWDNFGDGLRSLALPAAALALPQAAVLVRMMRVGTAEAVRSDHVRAAKARGLRRDQVILGHVVPSAIGTTFITIALGISTLLSGAVVIEILFNLPGVGRLTISALQGRDLPVLQGIVLVVALVHMAANLLAELAQAAVNPQVRVAA